MKTTILNTILSIALLLSVSNLYADGTRGAKENKKSKSEKVFEKLDNFKESEMVLETWMTEVKEFAIGEVFFEEEVNLENWMIEEFSTAFEAEIEIQEWMTETFSMDFEDINFETEVEIESWMINTENFQEDFTEEEVALEDWMCTII